MRTLLLVPAAVLILVGVTRSFAANDSDAFSWRVVGQSTGSPSPRYTIRAGPVDHTKANAVSGSFQVHRTGGPDGIPSARLSGGCLEFLAADLGFHQMAAKQCQKNSDCSTPGENVFAACDASKKQCWSRPAGLAASAMLCNRGVIAPPNELIPVPAQPADVTQLGIRPGAHVRVGACLNEAGINPQATGCLTSDGADKIQAWGPITTIR